MGLFEAWQWSDDGGGRITIRGGWDLVGGVEGGVVRQNSLRVDTWALFVADHSRRRLSILSIHIFLQLQTDFAPHKEDFPISVSRIPFDGSCFSILFVSSTDNIEDCLQGNT